MSEERFKPTAEDFKKKRAELWGRRYENASIPSISCLDEEQQSLLATFWKEVVCEKPKKTFLILIGPPGTGKTYICAAMLEWIATSFEDFRVWNENSFQTVLRVGIGKKQDVHQTVGFLADPKFVIYDDLGSQPPNDWRKEVTFHFVDDRYRNELATVITTNLDKAAISQLYDERTASRLFGKDSIVIDLSGHGDLRAEK